MEKESDTQERDKMQKKAEKERERESPVPVGIRRSTRERKPTTRLQVNWRSKQYDYGEVSDTFDDVLDDGDASLESSESDYIDALDSAEDH